MIRGIKGIMKIYECAVFVLSRLKISLGNILSFLELELSSGIHLELFSELENKSIVMGQITERITFSNYAVNILPKLKLHEDNYPGVISLDAESKNQIQAILETEDNSILIGKITRNVKMTEWAVNILPKLSINEETKMTYFKLRVSTEDQIENILRLEDKSISIEIISEKLSLTGHAVGILPNIEFPKGSKMRCLRLYTAGMNHIVDILELEDKSIYIGSVTQEIDLDCYSINILPKIR
eukprot:GHVP01067008.1.p1 GENE.GHVP01067008.1~~GHVP01067008.1.p1  ORF type:complete len:240 (+),score=30.89 GHVP01067008.1:1943-2662(+)